MTNSNNPSPNLNSGIIYLQINFYLNNYFSFMIFFFKIFKIDFYQATTGTKASVEIPQVFF